TTFGQVAGQKNTAVIRMLMMDPKPVARTGIEAMRRHRSSVIAGILNKLIVFSFRFTPRLMQGRIMQRAVSGSEESHKQNVSLIGIKPIIKCVRRQSCEHMETRPSPSGTGKNFVRQEP